MKLSLIFLSSLLWLSIHAQKTINIPIFNCNILIFNKLDTFLSYTNQNTVPYMECETVLYDGEIISYVKDSTCLDHEIIHITWFIAYLYGIKFSVDNHELQSYLFEYLKQETQKCQ